MAEMCPQPNPECRYYGTRACIVTTHHLVYPAREYQTPVEYAYRDMPENKVRLSRCDHDEVHRNEFPPEKPSLLEMLNALNRSQEHERAA